LSDNTYFIIIINYKIVRLGKDYIINVQYLFKKMKSLLSLDYLIKYNLNTKLNWIQINLNKNNKK